MHCFIERKKLKYKKSATEYIYQILNPFLTEITKTKKNIRRALDINILAKIGQTKQTSGTRNVFYFPWNYSTGLAEKGAWLLVFR